MNGPRGTSGKQRSGEGATGAGYIPAPDDVRSSLQYSALASLTPASAGSFFFYCFICLLESVI
jgi:hypothetical protein